jgi:hypothetical protein
MPERVARIVLLLSAILCCGAGYAANSAPWEFWLQSDDNNTAVIEHADWQIFLDAAVVRDKQRQINLLRYKSLADEQHSLLKNYLAYLQGLDPRTYNRNEQMAYWINFYNALTVQLVLDNPGKKSIRDMGKGLFSFGPWGDDLTSVAGQPLSLDDIEHRILRPGWQDRRIHFAVNCASIGCPDLAAQAYTGANLEASLDAAEKLYISHPRGVSFTAAGELQLSSLFDWYQSDFAPDEPALLEYLREHATPGVAERLANYRGPRSYVYDWRLNAVE